MSLNTTIFLVSIYQNVFSYIYWKWNFPMTRSVRLSVGLLVGRSVCQNFLKGRKVSLPWCIYFDINTYLNSVTNFIFYIQRVTYFLPSILNQEICTNRRPIWYTEGSIYWYICIHIYWLLRHSLDHMSTYLSMYFSIYPTGTISIEPSIYSVSYLPIYLSFYQYI